MPPVQAKIQIAIWKVRTGPTSFGQRGLLLILPFFFQFRLHGVSDCIIVHNQLPATQFQINPTDNGQRTTGFTYQIFSGKHNRNFSII
jgi:hypothetical protein